MWGKFKCSLPEKLEIINRYDNFINYFKSLTDCKFIDDSLVVQYIGTAKFEIDADDRVDEFIFYENISPLIIRKITTTLIFIRYKTRSGELKFSGPECSPPVSFNTYGFGSNGTIPGRYICCTDVSGVIDIFTFFINHIDECLLSLEIEKDYKDEQLDEN